MIKGQYVCNGVVEILGLIQDGLAVEGGEFFVEVDGEEVERELLGAVVDIMIGCAIAKVFGFGCERAYLLVATCVAGNEENRNSFYLYMVSFPLW
jgi:hypothetical protein